MQQISLLVEIPKVFFVYKWWFFGDGRWHIEDYYGRTIASADTYRELLERMPSYAEKIIACHESETGKSQHPFQHTDPNNHYHKLYKERE